MNEPNLATPEAFSNRALGVLGFRLQGSGFLKEVWDSGFQGLGLGWIGVQGLRVSGSSTICCHLLWFSTGF